MKRLLRTNSFFALLALPLFCYLLMLWYSKGMALEEAEQTVSLFFGHSDIGGKWVAGGVVLLISLLCFFQNERLRFLQQTTVLPSLVYLITVLRVVPIYGFNVTLLSSVPVFLATVSMQNAIFYQKENSHVFWFGLFSMTAVLLNLKLFLLLPGALLILIMISRFTLRDVVALILGWFAALYISLAGVVLYGDIAIIPELLESLDIDFYFNIGTHIDAIREILLSLLVIVFITVSLLLYMPSVYYIKRNFVANVVLLVIFLMSLFLFEGITYDFLYIFGIPLAWLVSHYLMLYRSKVGNLLCLLYILISLIPVMAG